MRQQLKVLCINDVESLIKEIDFVIEGYHQLMKLGPNKFYISLKDYLQLLFKTVTKDPTDGCVMVVKSKNDKPLGYFVLFNNTAPGCPSSCVIYAGYSTNRYIGLAEDGMTLAEAWARRNGYKQIQALSPRMAGAAMRFFKRKLGFTPMSIIFKKDL